MKTLGIVAIVTATLLLTLPCVRADESFTKRTVYRLEKNSNNAAQEDKISVKVGDVIEIEWTYPVVPGAIPYDAKGKSDGEAVKSVEVIRVVRPKLVGAGRLAAVFKAEKEGKATLTFDVKSKAKDGDDTGAVLKCSVEVKK
jgi:hypothetical protein